MNNEYKELIKLVEERKKVLNNKLKKKIFFKKKIIEIINNYDELLLELYTKYETK